MNAKIISLVAGMTLIAGMSAANAEEAMQLSTAQMDGITAGTGGDPTFFDYEQFKIQVWVDDYKNIRTNTDLDGNSAVAKADAGAYCSFVPCETTAQGLSFSEAVDGVYSTATSVSISATDSPLTAGIP